MPAPKHIAIIMDGNGRWAKTHGHHRFFGHVRGARVAKSIIEASAEKGLKYLTLFAFSTENWLRPNEEVHLLMRLLFSRLKREGTNLVKNNIRFRCIGDLNRLPAFVREVVLETLAKTRHCTGMTLVFALSYGGRQEITWAVREIAHLVKAGEISPEEIDDQVLS
ncbi:MAG: di-trans,poly-cis-decaprenylcistransferase, partial [Bdellovibrionales bacterium]|nr:di-trans,poly-cis-decaprenylcistransferase [Bdellovibrionales bacterium]